MPILDQNHNNESLPNKYCHSARGSHPEWEQEDIEAIKEIEAAIDSFKKYRRESLFNPAFQKTMGSILVNLKTLKKALIEAYEYNYDKTYS